MKSLILTIIRYIPRMWKAVTAAVATGSFTYGGLQVDGMTLPEWGYLAVAVVASGLAAWKVANAPAERTETLSTAPEPGT